MTKSKNPGIEINAKINGAEDFKEWCKTKGGSSGASHGSAGALYFVGFIGAVVYWWQAANGFGAVVTGLLKALVWPAYVVYNLLENFYGIVN